MDTLLHLSLRCRLRVLVASSYIPLGRALTTRMPSAYAAWYAVKVVLDPAVAIYHL